MKQRQNPSRSKSGTSGSAALGFLAVAGALAIVAILAAAGFLSIGRANDAGQTKPGSAGRDLSGAGSAEPKRIVVPGKVEPIEGQLNLAFDTPGVLRKMNVEEGDWVEKGVVLAELVNDEIQGKLRAAQFEAERAKAYSDMLETGARQEDVDEAKADMSRTEAWVAYYDRLVSARENLQRQRAIAAEELLEFRQRLEEAQKQRDAAAARLARLVAGPRMEEKRMAKADAAAANAKVQELAAALERTRLRAPRAGQILRVLRREGESVMGVEASPVILLADVNRLQIRAEVDERQVDFVKPNAKVRFQPFGIAERTFEAKVVRMNSLMGRKSIASDDPREKFDTRVFEVIVSVPDPKAVLINQRVDVTIFE